MEMGLLGGMQEDKSREVVGMYSSPPTYAIIVFPKNVAYSRVHISLDTDFF